MKLFTTGKLKITGNVMASQKLEFLKKIDPADVMAAMKERTGSGGAAASAAPASAAKTAAAPAAASAAAPAQEGRAKEVFAALEQRLLANPALAKEVGAIVVVKVKDPESTYTIDTKAGNKFVGNGAVASPDAVVTLTDAALHELASGKASVASLYQHGRLRVDGAIAAARHLDILSKLV
jgi:3-hydroxyacyl-CoA dehydrogenase/3a,7a,12a-trihydroxy-5b-cholest-24-enoyl-CoA hydratase